MSVDLELMKKVGSSATRQAGQLAWKAFLKRDFAIHSKSSSGDLVTEIDHAAERLIVEEIQKYFPHHAIHSEECGALGSADAEAEDLYPGILLLQEAGGVVMDFEGKIFSGRREGASLIGCLPHNRDRILKLVQEGLSL